MNVLVVGGHVEDVARACSIAVRNGATVRHLANAASALDALRRGPSANILLAEVNQDIAGIIRTLLAEHFHLPVVAYGINCDPRAAVDAIRAGAQEFLPLPPEPELIAAILEAVASDESELVLEDQAMRSVVDLARQYAPADASVLITGESGTGKEVMARYIHQNSRRAKAPFVSVNCAAIPENLLESELFGHEKGAFTGAAARRIGKFEEANGGTLLLDEISEMDVRLQAKLLRAIQEREIDRVGGSKPVKVDIRLLATSNRDMAEAVRAGAFREDLYFRLDVLRVDIPPLRQRPKDIEALAKHFAKKYALANQLPMRPISERAMQALLAHRWRGNVRELENCMHRAVLLASGKMIDADQILLQGAAKVDTEERQTTPGLGIGSTVAAVERDLILGTLDHTLGNRTRAASILGISIRTLRNKLKQYGNEGVPIPRVDATHGYLSN